MGLACRKLFSCHQLQVRRWAMIQRLVPWPSYMYNYLACRLGCCQEMTGHWTPAQLRLIIDLSSIPSFRCLLVSPFTNGLNAASPPVSIHHAWLSASCQHGRQIILRKRFKLNTQLVRLYACVYTFTITNT